LAGTKGTPVSAPGHRGKSIKPERKVTIPFENNAVAAVLFGEFDANLAVLEARLGLEAVAHGNLLSLSGPEDGVETARKVLEGLYARAAKGQPVVPADVEGAIRLANGRAEMAGTPENGKSQPGTGNGKGEIRTRRKLVAARTQMQSAYIKALETKDLVLASGPAGTGKTYIAVAFAAQCWERGIIERLILSRPAVEAGERLGFLPGDMRDKVDPYLRPLYDALYDVLPPEKVERGLETGEIEIAPLAFMRGRTLSNAFVILDEAQNTTSMQMKMFLTRLGEGSHMVVTGDPTQVDLPKGQISGLSEALNLLKNIDDIATITFTRGDVVRRELVAKIVAAYEEATEI
jgi:phosphate starvation-inducible protein PhoH and related proteins